MGPPLTTLDAFANDAAAAARAASTRVCMSAGSSTGLVLGFSAVEVVRFADTAGFWGLWGLW